MNELNITMFSLNANGLGEETKREAVLKKLNSNGKGIYLIQETHSTEHTESGWESSWGNKNIYFSHGTSNKRGVAILVNEYDLTIKQVLKDSEGRFVIIDFILDNISYTIGNIYAPTRDKENLQMETFKTFCLKLEICSLENTLLGGDFNLYLNLKLDKLDSCRAPMIIPHIGTTLYPIWKLIIS
jgi:exonuclease III